MWIKVDPVFPDVKGYCEIFMNPTVQKNIFDKSIFWKGLRTTARQPYIELWKKIIE